MADGCKGTPSLLLGPLCLEPLAAVHAAVPPILHLVVAATVELAGNVGPPLSHSCHHLLNHLALLLANGIMVEAGLEVLVISLTALLC